jgi:RNA polymerase sigma-70 factor (ECF subfamily)
MTRVFETVPVIDMRRSMCLDIPSVCDETRLISLIVSGETGLFYDLIRPHQHRLRRVALALVRNETDAEDVVQETLLKAFLNLNGFRAEARLSTWLTSIALNEAKGYLRRRGLLAVEPIDSHSEDFWNWRDETANPYLASERREVEEIVSRAIAGLHPRYRNIYFLREVNELSTQEAAKELGISLSAAKTRLHRARRLLQERLRVLMETPGVRRSSVQPTCEPFIEPSGLAAKGRSTKSEDRVSSRRIKNPRVRDISASEPRDTHQIVTSIEIRTLLIGDTGFPGVETVFSRDTTHV